MRGVTRDGLKSCSARAAGRGRRAADRPWLSNDVRHEACSHFECAFSAQPHSPLSPPLGQVRSPQEGPGLRTRKPRVCNASSPDAIRSLCTTSPLPSQPRTPRETTTNHDGRCTASIATRTASRPSFPTTPSHPARFRKANSTTCIITPSALPAKAKWTPLAGAPQFKCTHGQKLLHVRKGS